MSKKLNEYLRYYYPHLTVDDIEPTNVKGYWQTKEMCPGGEDCRHAFRAWLGACEGTRFLTIRFVDEYRDKETGKFVSPYRTWDEAIKNA